MRVAIYQMEDRGEAGENIEQACRAIKGTAADFFVLPEFFAIPGGDFKKGYTLKECWEETGKPAIEMLKKASLSFPGYIIGGSVLEEGAEGYYNTCFVFKNGQFVVKYRKINITQEERDMGILPGNDIVTFDTKFGRAGLLICADSICEEVRDRVASQAQFIFLPISLTDPSHPRVEGHPLSVEMAQRYGVSVIKVSRVGIFGGRRVLSRSAVITPSAIIYEAGEGEELALIEL